MEYEMGERLNALIQQLNRIIEQNDEMINLIKGGEQEKDKKK